MHGRTERPRRARFVQGHRTHRVYEKAPGGPRCRMTVGNSRPVPLDDFAGGYVHELSELEPLVWRATQLAAPARIRTRLPRSNARSHVGECARFGA